MNNITILGIETSCDETAASIVINGREIVSNVIHSQIPIHMRYGGVVPEIASRNHVMNISEVVDSAIKEANMDFSDIDAIAVTIGPGLVGALLVGVNYAKSLAYALNKDYMEVHHIEGHICSNYLHYKELEPPFLCLVVSGGHTHLINVQDYDKYEILGRTRDDAVGEAYDKVSRTLGLTYPGGPKIDELSKNGVCSIEFPRAIMNEGYDFSFSGVKSAVLNYINKCKMTDTDYVIEDVARSFQESVVDVLTRKTIDLALKLEGTNKVVLAGGVACNKRLREKMEELCVINKLEFYVPPPKLCTDNAAMIASRGYYSYINNENNKSKIKLDSNAIPTLGIGVL